MRLREFVFNDYCSLNVGSLLIPTWEDIFAEDITDSNNLSTT